MTSRNDDWLEVDPSGAPPSLLPKALLYATSARLGGSGLDVTSLESARAAAGHGFLRRAIAYANQQEEIPAKLVRSLGWHPVRALSFLGSEHYYGAKKQYVDWIAERELRRGGYDFFHGWSGDSLRTLVAAKQMGIPSVIDIPTWHRNKGRVKPFFTKTEREAMQLRGWKKWKHNLLPSRQRILLEYALADGIFAPSTRSAESFLAAGVAPEKIEIIGRGVNVSKFTPASQPSLFRLIFVGALIERKGVHHLLRAWKKLALKDAELLLVGTAHPEIKPALKECGMANVRVTGFVKNVPALLRESSAFVFPSELEGAAKAVFEAAACGLPIITTRESGDAVADGLTGRIIPANDGDSLASAMLDFYHSPEKLAPMGLAGRERMERYFTWDHFRARILRGYSRWLSARLG